MVNNNQLHTNPEDRGPLETLLVDANIEMGTTYPATLDAAEMWCEGALESDVDIIINFLELIGPSIVETNTLARYLAAHSTNRSN